MPCRWGGSHLHPKQDMPQRRRLYELEPHSQGQMMFAAHRQQNKEAFQPPPRRPVVAGTGEVSLPATHFLRVVSHLALYPDLGALCRNPRMDFVFQ